MEIEIYEDVELRELQDDTERRTHQAIASSLNLDTQMAFSSSDAPSPYTEVDSYTRAVYVAVFDQSAQLVAYKQPIPNRILMLIQIGVEHGWWQLEDLHVRWSGAVEDPVLYRKPEDAPSYSDRMILIARWGDALLPFPELAKKAVELARAKSGQQLREKIAILTSRLDNLDAEVAAAFAGGSTSVSLY